MVIASGSGETDLRNELHVEAGHWRDSIAVDDFQKTNQAAGAALTVKLPNVAAVSRVFVVFAHTGETEKWDFIWIMALHVRLRSFEHEFPARWEARHGDLLLWKSSR